MFSFEKQLQKTTLQNSFVLFVHGSISNVLTSLAILFPLSCEFISILGKVVVLFMALYQSQMLFSIKQS